MTDLAAALVVHLTVAHRADDVRILVKECASLVRAGYQVVLIAPGPVPEETYGVDVRPIERSNGRLGRLLRTQWRLYQSARRLRPAAFHFHDPELMLSAILLARRAAVVYDVHENYAAQARTRPWIPSVLRPFVSRAVKVLEQRIARRCRGIVAATEPIAEQFQGQLDVAVVRNYPRLEEFTTPGAGNRQPVVAYVGDVTVVRGATEMVEAIGRTQGAELEMAGRFSPPEIEAALRSMPGWERVRWRGWLSRAEVAELLGRASVGLLLLHPVQNYLDALPVKLFEYMAAGLPVVASDFPGWRPLVADTGSGVLVDPFDAVAVAQAIDWLLTHPDEAAEMGLRGTRAVREQFNWGREEAELTSFYGRILARA